MNTFTKAQRSSHRGAEVDARNQLGLIHAALGDFQTAIAEHTTALRLVTEVGWPQKQAEVLNDLGTTLAAHHDHAAALQRHRAALAIADDLNATHERSRAEAGIAAAAAALRAELGERQTSSAEGVRAFCPLWTLLGCSSPGRAAMRTPLLARVGVRLGDGVQLQEMVDRLAPGDA